MSRRNELIATGRVWLAASAAMALLSLAACSDDGGDGGGGDGGGSGVDPAIQDQIDEGDRLGAEVNDAFDAELVGEDEVVVICKSAEIGAALNEGEILHAEIALDLAVDPEVVDFAQMLIDDHSANIEETELLLAERDMEPIPTPIADDLRAEASASADLLESTPEEEFDLVFIDMQLMMHAQASAIVGDFDDRVADDEMAVFWQDTQDVIELHLDHAVDIAETQ